MNPHAWELGYGYDVEYFGRKNLEGLESTKTGQVPNALTADPPATFTTHVKTNKHTQTRNGLRICYV